MIAVSYILATLLQILVFLIIMFVFASPFIFMVWCLWIAMGGHEQYYWTDEVRRKQLEQMFCHRAT